MNTKDTLSFSQAWVSAWNSHDIERVLAFFSEDVLFTSPVAAKVLPETNGVVRGKDALRRYWQSALSVIPDLRFTVEAVYQGINTIVVNYRNHRGDLVNEVLTFEGDLIAEGHGTYLIASDQSFT
ncbi:nuclear transport factor 2 family protein [Mycobacteroides abscessus]|uniref:nuclear transport factor 2 family protein n=1 Tax=Mycobacteroides abscessus TaxID=36809 RepID=UPI000C26B18A|nr:nuclear transport factor 2 family protein [Mycobacteroides abscessus]